MEKGINQSQETMRNTCEAIADLGLYFTGIAENLDGFQIRMNSADLDAFERAIELLEQAAEILKPYQLD